LGVKNNGIGFTLADKDKSYETNYFSVFGTLDLSFLQLSGGYILKGRAIYALEDYHDTGHGYFISVQAAYQF
jgi:hypothetical protein